MQHPLFPLFGNPVRQACSLAVLAVSVAAAMVCQPALAEPSTDSDLPDPVLVRQLLLNRPEVLAANAADKADRAEADRLRAGPYEYTVRLTGQQRRASDVATEGGITRSRYTEGQLALERTLRAPGKSEVDEQVGTATIDLATLRREDAIHEAARAMLRSWVDWLRDRAVVQLWQDQVQAQQDLVRMAGRRVRAGDAAQLELKAQEAALIQTQAQLVAAQASEASSRALLQQHYPGLDARPADLARPSDAEAPKGDDAAMVDLLESRSHELQLARREAQLAEVKARKQGMEQRTDPTVGVFASSERGGAEKVLGVSFSLPIGGEARSAASRQAQAQAVQAQEAFRIVQMKVRAEAASTWMRGRALRQSWVLQDAAKAQQQAVLKTTLKGWELGEFSQADAVLARKQYVEAALAEVQARADARHASLRLRLDLHELWEYDDE